MHGSDRDSEDGLAGDKAEELGHDPSYEYGLKLSVRKAVASLLPVQRDAAEAVLLNGLTVKEYADGIGISYKTAEHRVERAKKSLRILLSEWGKT